VAARPKECRGHLAQKFPPLNSQPVRVNQSGIREGQGSKNLCSRTLRPFFFEPGQGPPGATCRPSEWEGGV
jgi:hypothetical protein